MVRVGILGGRGYTALELIRLLLRHPEVEITALTTRDDDRPHVAEVHPQFTGRLDLRLENLTAEEVAARCDTAFCCLPHAASAEMVARLLALGMRVIDFSADYRLDDPDVYESWYGVKHPDPGRLATTVYGLPELYREQIRGADLVANPGCYPTSAILALAPLLAAGKVAATGIVIDSKSGVSGAGRTPKLAFHFPECNESVAAYGVGCHRHMPEIDQILSQVSGHEIEVVFTPHLIPMHRGILTTAYATPAAGVDEADLQQTLRDYYQNEPFVVVVDGLPATGHVAGTNYCHVTARLARGRVIVVSVLDNLVKGASGAAVQNFNLVHGFPETHALV